MTAVLFLGFLIGMQHAVEADHVAAVASLASRARTVRQVVRHGVVWGIGHSLTLLVVGGAVVMLDSIVPERLVRGLEVIVGVMLIALGIGVVRRLVQERIHFHLHRHGNEVVHLHAHSHRNDDAAHDPSRHEHTHPRSLPIRTLWVGVIHGMAGSAALIVLALASVQSVLLGMLYIVMFCVGSIVGMAALSALIAVPLTYSARLLTWGHHVLQGAVGGVTILIGCVIVYRYGLAGWLGT